MVMNAENGWLAGHPLAVPAGLAVMLALGALVGAFNGLAVTRFRMPAFIVTLATMIGVSGFAIWLTQSKSINQLPAVFNALGGRTPVAFALALAAGVVVHGCSAARFLAAGSTRVTTPGAHLSGVPSLASDLTPISAPGSSPVRRIVTPAAETCSPVLVNGYCRVSAPPSSVAQSFRRQGPGAVDALRVLFLKLVDNSLN